MTLDKVFLVGDIHNAPFKRQRSLAAIDTIKPTTVFSESGNMQWCAYLMEEAIRKLKQKRVEEFRNENPANYKWYEDFQTDIAGAVEDYNKGKNRAIHFRYIDDVGFSIRTERENEHKLKDQTEIELEWKSVYASITPRMKDILRQNWDKLRSYDANPRVALRWAFKDIYISAPIDEIFRVCPILDVEYYRSSGKPPQSIEKAIKKRDADWLEKLIKSDGTALLNCGAGHIFGEYENLYEQLKAKGIPVERALSIDFTPESIQRPGMNPIRRDDYLKLVKKAHEKYPEN